MEASLRDWVDLAEVLTGISAIVALVFSYKAYQLTRRDFQLNLEPLLFTAHRQVHLALTLTHQFQGRSHYTIAEGAAHDALTITNFGNRPALNAMAVFQVDWVGRWGNLSDHVRVPDRMFLVPLDRNFLHRDDHVTISVVNLVQLADHANQAQLIGGRLFLRYEDLAGRTYWSCLLLEVRKRLAEGAHQDGPMHLQLDFPAIQRLRKPPAEAAEYLATYVQTKDPQGRAARIRPGRRSNWFGSRSTRALHRH